MKKNHVLFSLGVIVVVLIAMFGGLEKNALWGLLLLPFFFIGEPWYKSFKKKRN